ncbi:MAG TPA: hypothetical protein VKA84_08900, partial [Gemmatimonadaceae bacterium]|nr:hypothetical protein [Gemmatimonadaceae bacterium]
MSNDEQAGYGLRATGFAPKAHVLSNGRYVVAITDRGTGYSAYEGLALTRWAPDRTRDADGLLVYVRDLDDGTWWTTGGTAAGRPAESAGGSAGSGYAAHGRTTAGIATEVEICVSPDDDAELRRVTLSNETDRARRLELSTYAELVLNTPAADASHPAFSKLFVQTGRLPGGEGLLAWRRLRSPDDQPLWVFHRLLAGDGSGGVECETDRARFLGRGRSTADPRAMDAGARLSGTVGNVLDPVFSLRRVVELGPRARAEAMLVLGAARTREAAEALAERYADPGVAAAELERAKSGRGGNGPSGVEPLRVSLAYVGLTGALLYGDPRLA